MTARERVNTPDELRAGDRVEVFGPIAHGGPKCACIDLLYRTDVWWGFVVGVSALSVSANGVAIAVGDHACIYADNYPAGRVFVRRRSREGLVVSRAREVQR